MHHGPFCIHCFSNLLHGPWYEAALPGREAFCMRDVGKGSDFSYSLLRYRASNDTEKINRLCICIGIPQYSA